MLCESPEKSDSLTRTQKIGNLVPRSAKRLARNLEGNCPSNWGSLPPPVAESAPPPEKVKQYKSRLSGPFLDRMDLQVNVSQMRREEQEQLMASDCHTSETSSSVRSRITEARVRQLSRSSKSNTMLSQSEIRKTCQLEGADEEYLKQAMNKLGLSTRGFFRVLKVARTIADLDSVDRIRRKHLAEAITLRLPGMVTN